jgi:hypothetical protein
LSMANYGESPAPIGMARLQGLRQPRAVFLSHLSCDLRSTQAIFQRTGERRSSRAHLLPGVFCLIAAVLSIASAQQPAYGEVVARARNQVHAGQAEAAVRSGWEAIPLSSSPWEAHMIVGMAQPDLKDYAKAEMALRSAWSQAPNNEEKAIQLLLDRAVIGKQNGAPAPRAVAPVAARYAFVDPRITDRVAAGYTAEARVAGLQGTVAVYLEVTEESQPANVQVVQGLGMGLEIEVNFRLL